MCGAESFSLPCGLASVELLFYSNEFGVLTKGEASCFDKVLGDFGNALFAFVDCKIGPVGEFFVNLEAEI